MLFGSIFKSVNARPFVLIVFILTINGCEQPLRMADQPQAAKTLVVEGRTPRESYRWPVGQKYFDSIAPSRLTFFGKSRESVQAFLESRIWEQNTGPIFVPYGMSEKILSLVERVKLPRSEASTILTIPITKTISCYAISRSGNRVAVFDSGTLTLWDVHVGQTEKTLSVKLRQPDRMVFDIDQTHLYVADGDELLRIELAGDVVVSKSKKFSSKIAQIASAVDVNKIVIRCESGEVYISNENLDVVNQLPKVVTTGDVSISEAGDRIAFWNQDTPTEIELLDMEFGRKEIVEDVAHLDSARGVICGRYTTQWFLGRQIFHWWHSDIGKPLTDRLWFDLDLTWSPVSVTPISPFDLTDSRVLVAQRKNMDGEWEKVVADFNCYSGVSSVPFILPADAASVSFNYRGDRIAFQTGNEIRVCKRVPWQYHSHETFFSDAVDILLSEGTLEQFELLGEFILRNDFWWSYGVSPQDAFMQYAKSMGEVWHGLESTNATSEDTDTKLRLLKQLYESESDFARSASGFRRISAAWYAGKTTNRSRFTKQASVDFAAQMRELRIDISPMLRKAKPCNAAFALLLFYTLASEPDWNQVDLILERSVKQHPDCFGTFLVNVKLLTPLWLGSSDEISSFTRELKSLYGDERGAALYTRLCTEACQMWADRRALWNATMLNTETMIEGLDLLSRRGWMDKRLFEKSFAALYSKENADHKLRNILESYYSQNVFVPSLQVLKAKTSYLVSNAARYHVLRFRAQICREPVPEFFE